MAAAATKRFSQSVETWQMRLQVMMQLKSDDVTQCFEEAIKHVKSQVCAGFIDLSVLVLGRKPLIFDSTPVYFLGCFAIMDSLGGME